MPRHDALILGGGPAGAQCALWLKLLGHDPLLLEKKETVGGLQGQNPYENHWIVCTPGLTGFEMAQSIRRSLAQHEVPFVTGVQGIDLTDTGKEFRVAVPDISARFLVLATGVIHKSGGLRPSDRVIIGSGTIIQNADFKDKRVAILGGGDTAMENYRFILEKGARSVRVFARTVRARETIVNMVPPEHLHCGAYTADDKNITVNGEQFDTLCVMYGWGPVNPLPAAIPLATREGGFLKVDNECRTSHPRIFAIGEVTQRMHPCVTTAMADGVVAAKAIQRELEG